MGYLTWISCLEAVGKKVKGQKKRETYDKRASESVKKVMDLLG